MVPHLHFPIDRQKFFENNFEREPLLIKDCFDARSFDWSIIDAALSLQDPRREMLKVLKGGRVELEEYVEEFVDIGIPRRRILKDKLYGFLSQGATIVLNRIELVSPAMLDLCMQVGRLVGAQTTGNCYACFGGEPATNVHWDTHDVFVLQLVGTKDWKVYEPTFPLPLSNQVSNDLKDQAPEVPFLHHELRAGEALYVPRGWWHRVAPVQDSDTIHLTVAIHTPLILDYLIWACSNLFPSFAEMRHSLVGRRAEKDLLQAAMPTLVNALLDSRSYNAFRARSRERERVVTPFQIDELLSSKRALGSGDYIRINSRSAVATDKQYLINGKRIAIDDGALLEVMACLSNHTEISIGELAESLPAINSHVLQTLLKGLIQADIVELVKR